MVIRIIDVCVRGETRLLVSPMEISDLLLYARCLDGDLEANEATERYTCGRKHAR